MIISRTPFRISFFGGGTDYPAWYMKNGGQVLATTFDKYSYISCRLLPPFFEHKFRLVYSNIETVNHPSEMDHPAAKAVLCEMGQEAGLEIHYDGDLPARSGLGTSSAFTVGMINAVYALRGQRISSEELASQALHIEQNVIKEHVGSQDQICAAFGGFNHIKFKRDGSFDVSPMILSKERKQQFESHLMLFFTGFSRTAAKIAKSKIDNFNNREKSLLKMHAMVDEAISIVQRDQTPLEYFGELMHENWELKKSLSDQVSTPKIDEIYDVARSAGAIGGKLLGAGGGGFLCLFVKPEMRSQVREALKHFIHVPFRFENSGSKIVLYQPNGLG
ncbi:MAG: kinase [Bdellovibrionaceae bacterium]|nr:hypothetical protein [Bdellovibrionales bacterium]MCB9254423.1 kinase [Pseudobdellovibrionaceae bacterium]